MFCMRDLSCDQRCCSATAIVGLVLPIAATKPHVKVGWATFYLLRRRAPRGDNSRIVMMSWLWEGSALPTSFWLWTSADPSRCMKACYWSVDLRVCRCAIACTVGVLFHMVYSWALLVVMQILSRVARDGLRNLWDDCLVTALRVSTAVQMTAKGPR